MSPTSSYWKNLCLKAVVQRPEEHVACGVFSEFILRHKTPEERFIICSQAKMKWRPDIKGDRRSEVPDFALVNYTTVGETPSFKLRLGVEVKQATYQMRELPPPSQIINNREVQAAFHSAYGQAEGQAKAAIKGRYAILGGTVQWILVVGPYWAPVFFGPFTEAELNVRAHKEEHPYEHRRYHPKWSPLTELNLLCDDTSFPRLEEIISQTDPQAERLVHGLNSCEFQV